MFEDRRLLKEEGIYRARYSSDIGSISAGMKRGAKVKGSFAGTIASMNREGPSRSGSVGISDMALVNASNIQDNGMTGLAAKIGDIATFPANLLGAEIGSSAAVEGVKLSTSQEEQLGMVKRFMSVASDQLDINEQAKVEGGVEKYVKRATATLNRKTGKGKESGVGYMTLRAAGNKLDKIVYNKGAYGEPLTKKDYQKALEEALLETSGGDMSAKKAKEMAASIVNNADDFEAVRAQMVHYGKKDSEDLSLWKGVHEEELNVGRLDQVKKMTDARIKDLRNQQEGLEETLGVDSFAGSYSDEEEDIQDLAGAVGGKGIAIRAAVAKAYTGDKKDGKQLVALQRKYNLSGKEIDKIAEEVGKLDKGMQKRLAEMSERGTVKQLEDYGTGQQEIGMQKAFGSAGFMKSLGKYSDKLEGYLSTKKGKLDAKGVAEQFTAEELDRMRKSENPEDRRMAGVISKAQGGDVAAQDELVSFAVNKDDVTKKAAGTKQGVVPSWLKMAAKATGSIWGMMAMEGIDAVFGGKSNEATEETLVTGAEGEEGRKLAKSDEALSSMEDIASSFAPAVQDFSKGAKLLREVMETERLRQLNNGS
jgi:hypothetical protein